MGKATISAVVGYATGVAVLLVLCAVGMALSGSNLDHGRQMLATWPPALILMAAAVIAAWFGYGVQRGKAHGRWASNAYVVAVSGIAGLFFGAVLLTLRGHLTPPDAIMEKEPFGYILFGGGVAGAAATTWFHRMAARDRCNGAKQTGQVVKL